jgi:predicted alpha/beta-hydrolase family hydrolase
MLHSLTLSSSSSSSSYCLSFGSSSSSSRRCSVIAADKRAKANLFVDLQRDVLPDGKPNTPWRRLKLRIQTATSLQVGCFGFVYMQNILEGWSSHIGPFLHRPFAVLDGILR